MRLIGPLFALLWSTGFIGAKYGLPYAEPMTFLAIRFALAAALLGAFWAIAQAPSPARATWPRVAWVGALMHGVYLGGVFTAISWGLGAGLAALITSLSPIVTALLSRWRLGETLSLGQTLGMALGFLGVGLVVAQQIDLKADDWPAMALCLVSTLALAVAAIDQRALGKPPMASSNAIQYVAAAAVCAVGAFGWETRAVQWTPEFVFALGWLTLVLSIGAITLLYVMLRRGAASEATSLIFLTPAFTAVIAWAMFGETLAWLQIAGFIVACLGVGLVTKTLSLAWLRQAGRPSG